MTVPSPREWHRREAPYDRAEAFDRLIWPVVRVDGDLGTPIEHRQHAAQGGGADFLDPVANLCREIAATSALGVVDAALVGSFFAALIFGDQL